MIPNGIDQTEVTRILFQDFTPWMVALFYAYAVAAIAAFVWGVYVQARKYLRGVHPKSIAWPALTRRAAQAAYVIASHASVRRRDRSAGWLHAAIFYGFVLLFVGTSIITLDHDIAPVFHARFWYGAFYLVFKLTMNVAGAALIAGVLYMMYRRGWLRPPKLDYARPDRNPADADFDRTSYRIEDWAFLWTLILIGITGFIASGARLVWLQHEPAVWQTRWWSPVGAMVANLLQGLGFDAQGAGILRMALWWTHGLLALTFIALIPYTKAKHIVTAAATWLMRDPAAVARLPQGRLDQGSIGYKFIGDLDSRYLLQADTCTKCGRCHEACPARAAGYPLSPRDLILTIREHANRELGEFFPRAHEPISLIGEGVAQIRPDTLWACRQCGACTEICPVAVEHVPLINMFRRTLVDEGVMDPGLQRTLGAVNKTGNSFNESRRKRPQWTKQLPFAIKDARKEPVDVLWFVGDYASFDPRNQKVSRAFAKILHAAGVDFGILYEGETTAGNDIRRVGEEGLYQELAHGNIEALAKCTFDRIVTTDPHSYNTLKNEYRDFGGVYQVDHASAFLRELVASGRIALKQKLDYTVTYHDPCHLGRLNKGYDPPRDVIAQTGANLVELARNRDNSFCCGGGGGRVWIPDPPGTTKVGEIRAREAAEIEGLDVLLVNCPKCMTMLEDAVKTSGNEGKFRVLELTELLAEAMDLEARPAAKLALEAN
ncbi:MAG TPA: (Fe-S)-binding protein [Gemmataceae bacterium]|nr:(Fe-S)-binding protein [Gemmataceae bacterium]